MAVLGLFAFFLLVQFSAIEFDCMMAGIHPTPTEMFRKWFDRRIK